MAIEIVARQKHDGKIGRAIGAPPPKHHCHESANYRFSGYHLTYDTDGNILRNYGKNFMAQPAVWSRRATSEANFDLRAP